MESLINKTERNTYMKSVDFCFYWKNNLPIITAEYYLCESILAFPVNGSAVFSPFYNANIKNIKQTRDTLLTRLEEFFKVYIYMVCLGEVRHGTVNCFNFKDYTHPNGILNFLPKTYLRRQITYRHKLWNSAYKQAIKEVSIDRCNALCKVFSDESWNGGFGGEKWSSIACHLSSYLNGKINKTTFVDTAISLVHNNRLFVDKILENSISLFREVLNIKFSAQSPLILKMLCYSAFKKFENEHGFKLSSNNLLKYGEFLTWLETNAR